MIENKKKWMAVLCTVGLYCGGLADSSVVNAEEISTSGGNTAAVNETQTDAGTDGFSYADVADLTFWFSSGAGGWSTELTIDEDGFFSGNFHDSDMGSSGEGYPYGTMYWCDFSGQFSEPVKVNEYTYSAKIQSIQNEEETGKSVIIDEVRYIYSEPYGFDDAEEMLFYMPGAPLEELPEEFLRWVGYYDLSETEETELPFTGMYNEAAEEGFCSYETNDMYIDEPMSAIDMEIQEIDARAAEMEDQLSSGILAQQEMNRLSGELYMLWDDELNSMWGRIREILPEDEMAQLTAEELDWIAEKEAAVAEAGAEMEGGSMQPLLENTKAAEITRTRVYELAQYLR